MVRTVRVPYLAKKKSLTSLISNIYLKLETLQPSGSFKSRGIGHLMSRAIAENGNSSQIHFYCSSGGNAGIACATAAITLGRPATICVPRSTSNTIVQKLRTLGANVVVNGAHFYEADKFMRDELMSKDSNAHYVPPFDHPDVWEGNGTLVDELEKQMQDVGGYQGLVCSVGGGGLLTGIMEKLEAYGRLQGGSLDKRGVRVLAMETEGADSLSCSLKNQKLSKLDGITSIATSLGATQVAKRCFEMAQRPEVTSAVFSDAEAAMGSVCFADDERMLVEPACGVSIAPVYNDTLSTLLFPDLLDSEFSKLNVVIVVCGGSKASLQILDEYKRTYGNDARVVKEFHTRRFALEKKENSVQEVELL